MVVEIGTFAAEELALRFRDVDLGCLFLFLFLFFFFFLVVFFAICALRYDVVEIWGFGLATSALPGLFLALSFEVLGFFVVLDLELHGIVLDFFLSFLLFYHFSINLLLYFFEFLFILELASDALDSFFKKIPRAGFIFNSKVVLNGHRFYQSFGLFLIVQNIDFPSKERGKGFRTIEFHDEVLFEGV